jgi:tetratricopeptide (TPR) repeat protein
VPVAPKALDTLLVLLEDAGRVVSKDELLTRVWPDAFVEEGSIANNVSALRKILNPHFDGDGPIVTVAKRGYRFTAPVTIGHAVPEAAVVAPFAATSTRPVADGVHVASPFSAVAPGGSRRWPMALALTAALLVAAIVSGPGVTGSRFTASAPVRRSVAVLALKNLSGQTEHAWFSTALTETIGVELMAGAQFRMVAGENVLRMQRELALPAGVALTRKQLDAAGRDLGCDLILSGSFLAAGGKIRVDVRLDEVATGEPMASVSAVDDQGNLLALVQRTGAELRLKMGVAPPGAAHADAVRASFASNPAAIRLYFEGLDALRMRDGPRATDLLTRAVASAPNFALAHAALSSTWRVQGYERRAVEEAKRALDLSGRLSQEGRLGVEAQYYEVSLNWDKAIALYQTLWASYPDNAEYGLKLGSMLQLANRFNDALPVVEQLRGMPAADSRDPRIDLLEATIAERRSDYPRAQKAAAAAAEKARAAQAMLQLASTRVKQTVYAFRMGQLSDARTFVDEARQAFELFGDTGNLADARRWSGVLFLARGQFDAAVTELDAALQLSRQVNFARLTSEILAVQSDLWRQRGRLAEARTAIDAALQMARERDDRSSIARHLIQLGIVLKLQGDFGEARRAYQEAIQAFRATAEASNLSNAVNNIATSTWRRAISPRRAGRSKSSCRPIAAPAHRRRSRPASPTFRVCSACRAS